MSEIEQTQTLTTESNITKTNLLSILSQLEELYNWWFDPSNHKYWFNSTRTNDQMITEKFGLLTDFDLGQVSISLNLPQSIGYILAHDQIIRHCVRALDKPVSEIEYHYRLIEKFIEIFYNANKDVLEGYEFCFVLLPLRHTNVYWKINFVLGETWNKLDNLTRLEKEIEQEQVITTQIDETRQIYIRYLKATYERTKYNFVSEKPYLLLSYNNDTDNMHEQIESFVKKYESVLDIKSNYSYSSEYLRYNPDSCQIANECKQIAKSNNLIISISGGVDSMVISWVLKKMGYNIVLVHINYCNREGTDLEQNLVESWGKYLKTRVFVRKLSEINRPKCMENGLRNIYETYTRDQRYKSYIQVAKIMGWKDNFSVILGHNHDDCLENVFTNITSKTKYENLYGMEFSSIICSSDTPINFLRPMLRISKSTIYQVAMINNILFLWDSTPKWSQRGKLRDLVIPSLREFNAESINGFDELVIVNKQALECVDLLVNSWIKKIEITESYSKITIDITELNTNKIFWDGFYQKLKIRISTRCLDNFLEKISKIKSNFDNLTINNEYKFELNKNKKVHIIKNKNESITLKFV